MDQTVGMRGRGERTKRIGVLGVLDGIEMVIYGLGAVALLLLLMFVGIRAAHRIAGPVATGVATGAVLAVIGAVVRDARRRRWGPVSVGAVTAYVLCLLALIVADAVTGRP